MVESNKATTATLMQQVMLALVPGTLVMTWFFGVGILFNVCLAVLFSALCEAAALSLRKRPVVTALADNSALLAGWLLALTLPPLAPWWITLIGAIAAIGFGKHLYGGLGSNPFNPAMLGYAVLIVSFPREMTAWISVDQSLPLLEILKHTAGVANWQVAQWDAVTMATPLDLLKTALREQPGQSVLLTGARHWHFINLAFLLGGLYLLFKQVISWHIPLSLLSALALAYAVNYWLYGGSLSPLGGIFSGAAMLAAFFIATDPVSAATSPRGRIVYAAGIGLLIFVIRQWGHFPEGVAFAVLLMNIVAPAIDYFYRPRAFGQ